MRNDGGQHPGMERSQEMGTLNAKRTSSTARALWGLLAATVLLAWVGSAVAQPPPYYFASDMPAGYVVLPKVLVHTTGPGNPPVAPGGDIVDTLIKLTNTNLAEPITVNCYYLNANGHCGGSGGRVCAANSDCPGFQACVPDCQPRNFQLTLTPGQPLAWAASVGLGTGEAPPLPCSQLGGCGVGGDQSAGAVPPVPENPFRGEMKCVQVEVSDNPQPRESPVAENDLKVEATIILVEATRGLGRALTAAYNGIGLQADEDAPQGADSDGPLCLGDNPDPNGDNGDCAMMYAPCPTVLIVDHFFDGAEMPFGGVVDTALTLAPCSEDLGLATAPPVTVTAQMLVYNEFEQRFSTSERVTCLMNRALADIDTRPGPADDMYSLFSVNVQGTLAGQTRIRGVQGAPGLMGYRLMGVAQEFYRGQAGAPAQSSSAFNLHRATGDGSGADAVYRAITP